MPRCWTAPRRPMMYWLFLGLIWMGVDASSAESPNVILILADDLGYGDLGCYGSRINQTPHIDALARGGLRFTDYHSAGPMCSPTRAALLTGQYQQRFGRAFDHALSGTGHRDIGLPLEAVTMAEVLKARGYATACFGKWHLGYEPRWFPTKQGFDHFRGLSSGDGDFHTHIDRAGNEDWWHNDAIEMETGYTTDLLTAHSLAFIKANKDRPFFLYLPHLAIHFPWQGPDDPPHRQKGTSYHKDKWGIIPNPSNVQPHVKAMVEALDASVGAIMQAVDELTIADKTLVIFTSDNGGYLNYGPTYHNISSNGPLRGQKTELYEGGHRVPMIVSWPARIRPGVTKATTHTVDLLPTIAALAGVKATSFTTDGVDLAPLLFEKKPVPDRMLFWRAGRDHAVRHGPWKLLRAEGKVTLYNLDEDLGEQHDLSAQRSDLVKQLNSAWQRWNREVTASAERFGG